MRKIARVVKIDDVLPIKKADAIEACKIGGWKVVSKKDQFKPGDLGIYFEIDCFLPTGNPAWQFLVDKQNVEFNNTVGHVLRTSTFRGQISQGFLISTDNIPEEKRIIGTDVSDILGVTKYEPPIPEELLGKARGMFPSQVPKTDQERIQNIEEDLIEKKNQNISYELTEKLEGESTSYIWLNQELHVCSRKVDYLDIDIPSWKLAKQMKLKEMFELYFGEKNIAIQGELIGPGVEGNIYALDKHQFYCYDIYDIDEGKYFGSKQRLSVCDKLNINHVPVIGFVELNNKNTDIEQLLKNADGKSLIHPQQRREGVVYKSLDGDYSFKTISNEYLLKGAARVSSITYNLDIKP